MRIFPFQKASQEMIHFSGIDKHQDITESIQKKNISNEAEYGSVEDPLSMHKTGSNETALVSEVPPIINDKIVIIGEHKGEHQFQFSTMNFVNSKYFLSFLLKVNLAIKFRKIFQ